MGSQRVRHSLVTEQTTRITGPESDRVKFPEAVVAES